MTESIRCQTMSKVTASAAAMAETTSHEEFMAVAAETIQGLIAGEELLWTEISAIDGSARALSGAGLRLDARLSTDLSLYGRDHPAVQSYLLPGDDRAPRRVSDVASWHRWLNSAAYTEVFRHHSARYQLSLVASLDGVGGRGWVLTRDLHDFDEKDVEVARALLPMLVLFDRVANVDRWPTGGPDTDLTARELDMLGLLNLGLTAAAMARARGISEATVRKHLERIYRKLGTHDRLTTVHRAQQAGLLAP